MVINTSVHVHPSLIYAGQAGAYQSGALYEGGGLLLQKYLKSFGVFTAELFTVVIVAVS